MVDQMGGGGIISMYGKTAVYETWEVFSGCKYRGTSSIFCTMKTAVNAAEKTHFFF